MKLVTPKSAFATMSDLIMALSQLEQQREPLLDETFHQRLVQIEASLRAAIDALDKAKAAKRHATLQWRGQGGVMMRTVRDFHQSLQRATKRDPAALIWQEVYSLKQDLPASKALTSDWYEHARQIAMVGEAVSAKLVADDRAFAAPLPSGPSAEEVAATLPKALATRQAYVQACAALKQAEAAARDASDQGQRLLTGLRKHLTALFHGLSPEMRRVEMSRFGVRYKSAPPLVVTDDPEEVPSGQPLTKTA
jgi:hypothetical protein